ncbi:MAG: tRNA pseudouridine(55) synthase TruB [Legionellaceae bacterium]
MLTNKRYIAQAIDGIILVNKPQGLSSNAVLQRVKHLFHAKKAGHTGSLDPLATGMLPICFGEATKFCQYVLDADKCYDVSGLLGVTTDTGDSMGAVIAEVPSFDVSHEALLKTLPAFTGMIQQVPPMYSALKHQGKPLYRYARQGVSVERPPRSITIHALTLDRFDGKTLDLTVKCSKGTYIRSLIESIGEVLQVGAHVTRLHCICTAGFEGDRMYTLDELAQYAQQDLKDLLLPMDRAVMHLPKRIISEDDLLALRQGKQIKSHVIEDELGLVRLYDANGVFSGLGEQLDLETLTSKRLFSFPQSL